MSSAGALLNRMAQMNQVHVIKHSPEASIGTTADWLKSRGLVFKIHDASSTLVWPEVHDSDGIIVLGGDMEAWETGKFPWLAKEKSFLKEAVSRNIRIFGVCLGAQLLAEQLGGKVIPGDRWQVGWHSVRLLTSPIEIKLTPFHCHSSTFELPAGAVRTAWCSFCSNQAFALGSLYKGFQFHTEINALRMLKIISSWKFGLKGQTDSLLTTCLKTPLHLRSLRHFYFGELDQWWEAKAHA